VRQLDAFDPPQPFADLVLIGEVAAHSPNFHQHSIRRQVVEKWRRCRGSSEPISVVRDFFWEERLLQALLTPHFCAWQGRPGARDCDVAP
jgi:hypothetical protein